MIFGKVPKVILYAVFLESTLQLWKVKDLVLADLSSRNAST